MRISILQVKKALRKANPDRQYGYGAPEKFRSKASELVDLLALYVETKMVLPPRSGKGCRVQPHHIDEYFVDIQKMMYEAILNASLSKGDEEE